MISTRHVFCALLFLPFLSISTLTHSADNPECSITTVDGLSSDATFSSPNLSKARSNFISGCPDHAVRDCDPIPNSGGWVCSSTVIGYSAPGGLRVGETRGAYVTFGGSTTATVKTTSTSSVTNNTEYVGGGNDTGTTIHYEGNSSAGKIGTGDLLVLHYDNCPDPDDGHAMAAATSIIATYGLNNVLVVNGTCGNTIKNLYDANSEAVATAIFPSHLNAADNWSSAVNNSATKWISTLQAGNKIWVAEGGPSDFTADVVRRVISEYPDADLKSATVVQHAHGVSSWNEGKTDGVNLSYVENMTNYVTIDNGNHSNNTADLAEDSTYFVNAANNSDYALEWASAFQYLSSSRKLDFSDTVELLYFVGDDSVKTVDDFANTYIIPTRPAGVIIQDNVGNDAGDDETYTLSNGAIVMEAEGSTQTDGWETKTSIAGYTGDGYIEWTGPNRFYDTEARTGNTYSFTLAVAGNYELRLRSRITTGDNATEHNDSWVSFPTGQDIAGEEPLNGYTKVFMSQLNTWGWGTKTVDGVGKAVRQRFSAGTHTVMLSGRSTGHAVDRIVLYEYENTDFSESEFNTLAISDRNTNPSPDSTAAIAIATSDSTQSLTTESTITVDASAASGEPEYLVPFIDTPGFITTRVTDYKVFDVDADAARHQYSKRQAWNTDETLLIAGGKLIDTETYGVIETLPISNASVWSNIYSNVIYGIKYSPNPNHLVKYYVDTKVTETLYTFSDYSKCNIGASEGTITALDNKILISCESGDNYDLISFDVNTKSVIATIESKPEFNWASFSPLGMYIIIENNDGGPRELLRYNTDFTSPRLLTNSLEHGDFARDENGREVYAMINGDGFSYVRLVDGQVVNLNVDIPVGYGHLSCRSQIANQCFYSTYDGTMLGTISIPSVDSNYTTDEISVDVPTESWGLHYSSGSRYAVQAKGSFGRRGDRAIFTSDRMGKGSAASYVIRKISQSSSADSDISTTSSSTTSDDYSSYSRSQLAALTGEQVTWENNADNLNFVDNKLVATVYPNSGGSTHAQAGGRLTPSTTYSVFQTILLPNDFEYGGSVKSGKISFGLGGGTAPSGNNYDADGFTLRMVWRQSAATNNVPVAVIYSYTADGMYSSARDTFSSYELTRGVEHRMELRAELNTEGKSDGSFSLRANGVVIAQRNNVMFMEGVPSIDLWSMNFFYGGNTAAWSPEGMNYVTFSNVSFEP